VDDLLRTMIIMAYFSRLGVDTRLNRLIPFARTELYAEYGDALVPRDGTHAFSPTVPFQAAGYDAEIVDLVRRHPRVFPEFYSFATDDYAEKSALVEGVGDFMHHVEWPSAPTIARREVRTVAGGAVSAAVVRGSAPCASRREAPAAVEQRR
jgi:hypothetical protein